MKRGRKKIKIDDNVLETMLQYGATCLDCSDRFNCSEDTIVRYIKRKHGLNFAEYSNKRMATVRLKLREKQIQTALSGNITMLIFLGKNMLGQSDQVNINQTSNVVQLKYALQGTPDEIREQIKLAKETADSEGTSTNEGHSESK